MQTASPSSTSACPECDGQVATAGRETVCQECGLVVDEQRIDHGPEWGSYEDGAADARRTGGPVTPSRHDRGLSTEIGYKTDGNGNVLSGRKREHLSRLRRVHSRARFTAKVERNLSAAFTEIRRMVAALDLGYDVRDRACRLFRSAQDEDLIRGRSIEAVASAMLYAACRCSNVVCSMASIVTVARVDEDRIRSVYNSLNAELGLPVPVQRPADFIAGLASEFAVPDRTERRAFELSEAAHETPVSNGCNPAGVAAACLYQAAEEHSRVVHQGDLADAADVTAATLRNRREDLVEEVVG